MGPKMRVALVCLLAVLAVFLQPAFAQGGGPIIEKERSHDVSPALRGIIPVPPQARAPQVVPLLHIPSHGPRALQVDPVVQAAPGPAISTRAVQRRNRHGGPSLSGMR
jgi:hypothetical protein